MSKTPDFLALYSLASYALDNCSRWLSEGTPDFNILPVIENFCLRVDKWSELWYMQRFWVLRSHLPPP